MTAATGNLGWLGEAIYGVLRPAGFSDEATAGVVDALLTYVLGFVALELPRAGLRCWPASPPTISSSPA